MKITKKLASILMALMMVLTLAIPALAAGTTYTLTINNPASGHTYEAYQIFTGDLSDGVLSNIQWGAGVDSTALLAALKADTTVRTKFASAATAADVAKAMDGITSDSADAQAFAAVVGKNLADTATGTSTAGTGSYTISGLAAGYYLVKDKDNSQTGNDAYTRFITEVVKDVTATPKSDVPTVVKKVQENVKSADTIYGAGYNDVADYNIGDQVPFKLIGTLPSNYADYTSYKYAFHDTLSAGLTFTAGSVKVTADGADVTGSFTVPATGGKLDITCTDLKKIAGLTKDSKIEVTYTATLNNSAVIGLNGNPNEVYLEFSNNPNQGGEGNTGKTPVDKVIVFTYELDTTKVDGANKTTKLAGAEFQLYKDVAGVKTYAIVTEGKVSGWTLDATEATTLASDANGLFKVAGLDDSDYFLKEIKAPAGYNLLANDIKLTITATTANGQTWDGDPATALTKLELTANGTTAAGNTATGIVSATIENNKGSILPTTGGIGTTIFTVVGIVLMVGAGVLLITKKRMSSNG